jgi:alpha-N-arabinofuranosidase
MRRALIRSTAPATRLVAVALAGSTALTLALPTLGETAQAAGRNHRTGTTIVVQTGTPRGQVPVHELGVNHRFVDNGHRMWNPDTNAPNPVVMQRLQAAGVNAIRYPGGIVGNLFDWKKAIDRPDLGRGRGCQTHGQWTPQGYGRVKGNSYGVDEHMTVTEQVDAEAVLMVPFITETPSDAADWVEYMNSPADGPGGKNPNGGVDWADLRAQNGHPRAYNVKWWEIGNEQRVNHQRYWLSKNMKRALHQYIHGKTFRVTGEMLGRNCMHLNRGSRSNGRPGQVFQVLYPPADLVNVDVLDPQGQPAAGWTRVDPAQFAQAPGNAQVFEVNETEGEVTFGNGVNGAVLPPGYQVRASYTSVHKGVFAFIRAMRSVDRNIKTCVTWGLKEFIRAAGNRKYNCFTMHAYTHFRSEGTNHWATPLEGHDWHMIGTAKERDFVAKIKRALPNGTSLALTEFGTIFGDSKTYPEWTGSMTRATYMASMWVNWLNLQLPLAIGSDMLAKRDRALLGPAPDFAMSAEALTRQAIKPLFSSASRRLGVNLVGNPRRNGPTRRAGSYPALAVAATKARRNEVRIMVVNRFPTKRVRAHVNLRGFRSKGVALVSRVNGPSFRSWNTARVTEVHLKTDRRRISRSGFTEVFPAHSITVFRIPSRR